VDPNPKESESFGRIQILLRNKNNSEKSEVKHLKENKMYRYAFSTAELFLLF
jgi:hypothetical protein